MGETSYSPKIQIENLTKLVHQYFTLATFCLQSQFLFMIKLKLEKVHLNQWNLWKSWLTKSPLTLVQQDFGQYLGDFLNAVTKICMPPRCCTLYQKTEKLCGWSQVPGHGARSEEFDSPLCLIREVPACMALGKLYSLSLFPEVRMVNHSWVLTG